MPKNRAAFNQNLAKRFPSARPHLPNSPPRLLIIGNNYLKQLFFGAWALGLSAASQFAFRAHPT